MIWEEAAALSIICTDLRQSRNGIWNMYFFLKTFTRSQDSIKERNMNNNRLKKMTLTALFAALAVAGSLFSVPVFGSKCAPVQHLINILCAIFLGPWYGVAAAFISSLIRNLAGLGTLLAFPGSMCGALLSGLLYKQFKNRICAYAGEVFGTGVIGGLLAYPVAAFIMNNEAATLFMFVIPFLISTVAGAILAIIICESLSRTGLLARLKSQLNDEPVTADDNAIKQ